MPRVLVCPDEAFNSSTGECTAAVYQELPTAWPALPTVQQSVEISQAVAILWVVAWLLKTMGRTMQTGKPTNHEN